MIYVINYDNGKRRNLYAKLDALRQPFEIGTNEVLALKADKIILPDTNNPFRALRRLHMMNLHSALRMYPRPLLGIGAGFLLMLKSCNAKPCFSFFPYDAKYSEEDDDWKIYDESGNEIGDNYFVNGKYFGVKSKNDKEINQAIIDFVNCEQE
jgi:imidazoleglycerol phosphate synthase glutamine amidotransferase subunit HisH